MFISILMCFLQLRTAIIKLQHPPIVETSEVVALTDIELPVMYVCANNPFNETKVQQYGFKRIEDMLIGRRKNNTTVTYGFEGFWDIINDVLIYNISEEIYILITRNDQVH